MSFPVVKVGWIVPAAVRFSTGLRMTACAVTWTAEPVEPVMGIGMPKGDVSRETLVALLEEATDDLFDGHFLDRDIDHGQGLENLAGSLGYLSLGYGDGGFSAFGG